MLLNSVLFNIIRRVHIYEDFGHRYIDTVERDFLFVLFVCYCFLNDLLDFIRSQARICVRLFLYLHRKCRQCSV